MFAGSNFQFKNLLQLSFDFNSMHEKCYVECFAFINPLEFKHQVCLESWQLVVEVNANSYEDGVNIYHSQVLNIIILKFNSPVMLNLMGNIFPYCPAVGAIWRINSSNIDLPGNQCWICHWECLYCDLSREIQWNIAWALWKSPGLRPQDFPWAQAIFHCISLLLSQYRYIK